MNQTRVSICTSVLNQKDWLKEMIASVVAQTYKGWKLIIVDDGSTDDIKSVVDSFNDERIELHRFEENKGPPHGIRFALDRVESEFVGLLSADEVISPEKLAEQLVYMDEHPGVDCIWGLPGPGPMGLRPEWEQYALRAHNRSREAWLKTLLNLEGVPIGAASFLMKTEVLKSIGGLDAELTIFNDHELYCRFFSKGHIGRVLPYRWAVEKPAGTDCVRHKHAEKAEKELAEVRARYPLIVPSVTGKVTVGIPCFNHAHYLKEAVDSVLAQTHQDFELMILNDCSTDNFNEVAAQFTDPRIKCLAFDENRGIDAAANYMSSIAKGEFYVTLAADDKIAPTLLEKCLAEFGKNPWLEFVATQTDFFKPDGEPLEKEHGFHNIPQPINRTREEWLNELRVGNHYFGVGMFRTKTIAEVGGWDNRFKVISDYEMYLKILQRENIGVVEERLTHTRVDGKNRSLLRGFSAQELPQLYHEAKKPYYRQLMKVIIATPFYELKGFSPYITSLVQTIRLLTACGIDWRFMELSGDSYVHRARNSMCDAFLEDPDATDLFFIDSDMAWTPESFVKMCLLPEGVVGGSYPVKNNWEAWTSIPQMHEEDGRNHFKGKPLNDGTALIEAWVLAGGFLRIKRQVLEQYREHYPDLWYRESSSAPDQPDKKFTQFFAAEATNHQFYGEDHMFSKRLREMGIPMFIYPNATIAHFGVKAWTGNLDQHLKNEKKISLAAAEMGVN